MVTYPSGVLVRSINTLTDVSGHVKMSIPTDSNSPSDTATVDVTVTLTGYQDATLSVPFAITSHNVNSDHHHHDK